jgi:hypothetical protein
MSLSGPFHAGKVSTRRRAPVRLPFGWSTCGGDAKPERPGAEIREHSGGDANEEAFNRVQMSLRKEPWREMGRCGVVVVIKWTGRVTRLRAQ